MGYGKKTGFVKTTAVIIVLAFGMTLLMGVISPLMGTRNKAKADEEVSDEKVWLQPGEKIPVDLLEQAGGAAKYFTISQEGNIDIGVNYLSPVIGDKDTLVFEIIIGTHSVDLMKYKDIQKYVELRTDRGIVISDGFGWKLDNGQSHHISGILKIKNSIDGKPVVGPDTKAFRLVFRNIGASEREHVYEGDKLK